MSTYGEITPDQASAIADFVAGLEAGYVAAERKRRLTPLGQFVLDLATLWALERLIFRPWRLK